MMALEGAEDIQLGEIDERRLTPNRRGSSRRKILKSGRTFWSNGDSSECIVYNLSDTGARLDARSPVPNVFDLVVDGEPWRRSCVVIWRKENRIGVKFHAPSRPDPTIAKYSLARFMQFVEECRTLAQRADPSHRELLLEMADAWVVVVRRLRKSAP
jgi:hypothetical protein